MIDLLKNYKELNNATGYLGSVRYYLAKKKLDTLFVKWLNNNKPQIEAILTKAKQSKLKYSEEPAPFFPPRTNMSSSLNNGSAINFGNTITPPRPIDTSQPNRRPQLNQTYNPNLARSALFGRSLTVHPEINSNTQKIPQFYFPEGKPLDAPTNDNFKEQLAATFANDQYISEDKCIHLVRKVAGLPGYFTGLLVKKYGKQEKKISKQQFQSFWDQNSSKGPHKKAFDLLKTDANRKLLVMQDFKQILKVVMDIHPGLQFLKSSPEFQDFYSICVVNRMFYMANRKKDYKMSYREFKTSNILKSFYDIESESQINTNRDFFSYEDFYVIYIKFWELDTSHKFLLSKDDFSKYSGYSLSRKTIERIFSQNVKKFQNPQNMTFGDFVWFILCAQDKTTKQSIEYWFSILDLDNNGIVTGYQLQYFFEQQNQRLQDMDNTSTQFNYQNTICQMIDLLKPKQHLQFTVQDFLRKNKEVGVFINCLTDLNKMIANDQKDPYEDKAFKNQHPDWTQWDRFVKPEYKRVEAMDENQEEEVINWENDQ